jgi:hypothetical protein
MTTAATWWGGIVLLANDFAFTLTNVVAHGVPYMLVSQRVAYSHGQMQPERVEFDPRVHFALYTLALCALALGEEWLWDLSVWHEHTELFVTPQWDLSHLTAITVPLLTLPQLTHYALDAYLWRLDGNNPALERTLQLR